MSSCFASCSSACMCDNSSSSVFCSSCVPSFASCGKHSNEFFNPYPLLNKLGWKDTPLYKGVFNKFIDNINLKLKNKDLSLNDCFRLLDVIDKRQTRLKERDDEVDFLFVMGVGRDIIFKRRDEEFFRVNYFTNYDDYYFTIEKLTSLGLFNHKIKIERNYNDIIRVPSINHYIYNDEDNNDIRTERIYDDNISFIYSNYEEEYKGERLDRCFFKEKSNEYNNYEGRRYDEKRLINNNMIKLGVLCPNIKKNSIYPSSCECHLNKDNSYFCRCCLKKKTCKELNKYNDNSFKITKKGLDESLLICDDCIKNEEENYLYKSYGDKCLNFDNELNCDKCDDDCGDGHHYFKNIIKEYEDDNLNIDLTSHRSLDFYKDKTKNIFYNWIMDEDGNTLKEYFNIKVYCDGCIEEGYRPIDEDGEHINSNFFCDYCENDFLERENDSIDFGENCLLCEDCNDRDEEMLIHRLRTLRNADNNIFCSCGCGDFIGSVNEILNGRYRDRAEKYRDNDEEEEDINEAFKGALKKMDVKLYCDKHLYDNHILLNNYIETLPSKDFNFMEIFRGEETINGDKIRNCEECREEFKKEKYFYKNEDGEIIEGERHKIYINNDKGKWCEDCFKLTYKDLDDKGKLSIMINYDKKFYDLNTTLEYRRNIRREKIDCCYICMADEELFYPVYYKYMDNKFKDLKACSFCPHSLGFGCLIKMNGGKNEGFKFTCGYCRKDINTNHKNNIVNNFY